MSEGNSDPLSSPGVYHHMSLEQDNRRLVTKQVRSINDLLRKVRRINKESQHNLSPVVPSVLAKAEATASSIPAAESVKPSRSEDTTGRFMLQEPSDVSAVASAFSRALEAIEKETAQSRKLNGRGSAVVKSWKIA